MDSNFNESFQESGEKSGFIYKPNPLVPRSYQIFRYMEEKSDYEPVGEYTVVDTSEEIDITEKKMANLVSILNGRERLIQLGEMTKTRLMFQVVPGDDEDINQKVIFRTYDGDGISKENAVLVIEKGVINEQVE